RQFRAVCLQIAARAGLEPFSQDLQRLERIGRQPALLRLAQMQSQPDDLAPCRVDGVIMNAEHVARGKLLLFVELLAQPPRADGVAHGASAEAQGYPVERTDRAMV